MTSFHKKHSLQKDEESNDNNVDNDKECHENDVGDDEESHDDDIIDSDYKPPETLQKAIVCCSCNRVFNGKFIQEEIVYGEERQMGWNVYITYICEEECPNCGDIADDEITATYYMDSNGIAYDHDREIFSSKDIDASIRKQVYKPVICSFCRRKFNATYNMADSDSDSENVKYECETTCPRPGCPARIIDQIEDSYFISHNSILYERGDYSEEEEVEDNLYEFDRIDSDEQSSYNVINQGKGDSSVVVIGRCVIIYDFGYQRYAEHLKTCLSKIGERRDTEIVILIGSHDDQDHIGGLEELISYLRNLEPPPELFLISPLNKTQFDADKDIRVLGDERNINRSVIINLNDQSQLRVIYPKLKHDKKNNNKNSLIAIVFVNNNTIVLTGDQHFRAIDQTFDEFNIKETTILQIPHHASLYNFDGYKPLIPSRYYIISGTPVHDGGKVTSGKYQYNRKCQNFVLNQIISTKKTSFPVYLVATQPRIDEALEKYLRKIGINLISVDNAAYHSIDLTRRTSCSVNTKAKKQQSIKETTDTDVNEFCESVKSSYEDNHYQIANWTLAHEMPQEIVTDFEKDVLFDGARLTINGELFRLVTSLNICGGKQLVGIPGTTSNGQMIYLIRRFRGG